MVAKRAKSQVRMTSVSICDLQRSKRLVERYQQDKHRRAAKERNLDARKSRVLAELKAAAIGPENATIIRESQSLVETWRNELSSSLASISTEVFSDEMRRGVRKAQLRQESAAWGVPVSLFMTLLTEFSSRGKTAVARQPAELGARFHAHYHPFFQALQNLHQRIAAEFIGSALEDQAEDHGDGNGAGRSEAVTLEAARAFQAHIETEARKPKRWNRWAAHLPAALVLAMAVWSQVYPVLASASGRKRSWTAAITVQLSDRQPKSDVSDRNGTSDHSGLWCNGALGMGSV